MSYLEELARAIRTTIPTDRLPDTNDLDQLFLLYAMLARQGCGDERIGRP